MSQDDLNKLQTRLESMRIEEEKQEHYQVTLEAQLKDLSEELQKLNEEDVEQSAKLESLEVEKEAWTSLLAYQNDADVNFPHLMNKLSALRRHVSDKEKENQDIEAEIQRNELALEQEKEQVEMLVKEYNRIERELMQDRDDLSVKLAVTKGKLLQLQDLRVKLRELCAPLDEGLEAKNEEEQLKQRIERDELLTSSLVKESAELDEQIREEEQRHQRKMKCLMVKAPGGRHSELQEVLNAKKCLEEEEANLRELEARCNNEEEAYTTRISQCVDFILEREKGKESMIQQHIDTVRLFCADLEVTDDL